jgi:hypothetical protein
MSPWTLLAGLVLAISLFGGGYYKGNQAGINAEKVRTQGIIDGYNLQIAEQKAEANKQYRDAADQALKDQRKNELLTNELEKAHVQNQRDTNRLRDAYAAYSLRFHAEEDSGRGDSDHGAEGGKASAAGNATPAYCVVSREVDAALKSIAYDCDSLRDDYRLLYDWAHAEEATPN